MKALTLTQPWATLIAIGAKRIETRSWRTSYRGPLAIHAAKSFPAEERGLCFDRPFRQALEPTGLIDFAFDVTLALDSIERFTLPLGAIVCVTDLVDCCPTVSSIVQGRLSAGEPEAFGNYHAGRWAWILERPNILNTAVPCRGYQQLWTPDAATRAQVEAQL